MLKVQQFIRDNEDWEQLLAAAPYHIRMKHSYEDGHDLVLFNYTQGLSECCDITNECRSLVLDVSDNAKAVRYGFYRFYNYGEPNAATLGSKLSTTEKIDGSLILVYYYNNRWRIGTRSSFEADKDKPNGDMEVTSLREMYKQVRQYIDTNGLWSFDDLDKNCTYCFEFVSPDFPIIVPYNSVCLYFLMCRNNETLEEVQSDVNFIRPETYDFTDLKAIEEYVSKFNGLEFEGIVVMDENHNRVKVKNLNWLELHYLYHNGQFSDKYIIKLYFDNDYQELLSYFPNLKERFERVVERYNCIKKYARLMDKADWKRHYTKKEFYEIMSKTVNSRGFMMLVMKSYDCRAYESFCKLDVNRYCHYFLYKEGE